ncbi:hypothetical protein L2E82_51341 [Cichorium intybus]|nr:hypothetical protein L2E82_51341 [Cichorium intybus]
MRENRQDSGGEFRVNKADSKLQIRFQPRFQIWFYGSFVFPDFISKYIQTFGRICLFDEGEELRFIPFEPQDSKSLSLECGDFGSHLLNMVDGVQSLTSA